MFDLIPQRILYRKLSDSVLPSPAHLIKVLGNSCNKKIGLHMKIRLSMEYIPLAPNLH